MNKGFWVALSFCIVLFNFIFSTHSFARVYDWVTMGRNDIQVIVSPRVEAQIRIQMIRDAKKSIDLVTFDQRPDDAVGMPILDALEEAAIKGRTVRFAMDEMLMPMMDPKGLVRDRLKKIAARSKNFHYILVGGVSMWERGYKQIDGIHEKLMIIDGHVAMTTGRGQGEQYLHWLDTGFVFKGNLVAQSIEAFGILWKTLLRENPSQDLPRDRTDGDSSDEIAAFFTDDPKTVSVPQNSLVIQLFPNELKERDFLTEWLKEPASEGSEYRARLLHYDFLDQMRNLPKVQAGKKEPKDYRLKVRLRKLIDPVVDEVVEQLKTARSMKLAILSVILHPKTKAALTAKLKDTAGAKEPFQFEVFTNSKASHEGITPLNVPIGWYAGIPDFDDIMQIDNTVGYTLTDVKSPQDPVYIHRKLIIFNRDPDLANGREDSVIFGSHNLTYSSTTTLDEISFQIESNDFAKRMTDIFSDSTDTHGTLVDKKALHKDRLSNKISEWFSAFIDFMY